MQKNAAEMTKYPKEIRCRRRKVFSSLGKRLNSTVADKSLRLRSVLHLSANQKLVVMQMQTKMFIFLKQNKF